MAERRDPAKRPIRYVVSEVFGPDDLLETLRSEDGATTTFIRFQNGEVTACRFVDHGNERLVPFSASNNLFAHHVILVADQMSPYSTEESLFELVQSFIHRYVDVSVAFERVVATYVLLTWVYDAFDVVPYLRVRGDFGSGKTRFLTTIGSICYKPMFASGASTVSPLFRIIDTLRGTLVIDEGDFRFSDERAEVVKILNNGSARGFPVLRTEAISKREFEPRAYLVFGPKIIATRRDFSDPALESRCLTEEMGTERMRVDIPIILDDGFASGAVSLRNQLLSYRFRNFGRFLNSRRLADGVDDPRLRQMFSALFDVAVTDRVREDLIRYARQIQQASIERRGLDTEAQLLEVIRALVNGKEEFQISLATIAERFTEQHGVEYDYRVTTRWIGHMLRKKLHLFPRKSDGVYVLPVEELRKLSKLYEKFGIAGSSPSSEQNNAVGEAGEIGETPQVPPRSP
jgi:hypothetical protein